MNKLRKSQETGAALSLVVVAVILLTLMGMALLNLGLQGRLSAIRVTQGITGPVVSRCRAGKGCC